MLCKLYNRNNSVDIKRGMGYILNGILLQKNQDPHSDIESMETRFTVDWQDVRSLSREQFLSITRCPRCYQSIPAEFHPEAGGNVMNSGAGNGGNRQRNQRHQDV